MNILGRKGKIIDSTPLNAGGEKGGNGRGGQTE